MRFFSHSDILKSSDESGNKQRGSVDLLLHFFFWWGGGGGGGGEKEQFLKSRDKRPNEKN